MKITFEVVETKGIKQGTCHVCGRRRQRTETWMQTINPWNRTKSGLPKSRAQILEEIGAARRAWLAAPFVCRECE